MYTAGNQIRIVYFQIDNIEFSTYVRYLIEKKKISCFNGTK